MKKPLVTLGLKELILIETADAILAANKNELNKIKTVLNKLDKEGYKEVNT